MSRRGGGRQIFNLARIANKSNFVTDLLYWTLDILLSWFSEVLLSSILDLFLSWFSNVLLSWILDVWLSWFSWRFVILTLPVIWDRIKLLQIFLILAVLARSFQREGADWTGGQGSPPKAFLSCFWTDRALSSLLFVNYWRPRRVAVCFVLGDPVGINQQCSPPPTIGMSNIVVWGSAVQVSDVNLCTVLTTL